MYVSGEQGHSKIIQMNESWRMEMWYEIPAGFLIQPLSCVKGDGIYVLCLYIRCWSTVSLLLKLCGAYEASV